MTDVRRSGGRGREPPHRDDAPPAHELGEERLGRRDLGSRRRPVRARGARMRRHDVPEQDVLREAEAPEDAVDDRRRRLGRTAAAELPLGGERQAADAGAAVAGRLADEQKRRVEPRFEVLGEPPATKRLVRVLVVGRADSSVGEPGDEAAHRLSRMQ